MDLTAYRVKDGFVGDAAIDDGDPLLHVVDLPTNAEYQVHGPSDFDGFRALLVVTNTPPRMPPWAGTLEEGFGSLGITPRPAAAALLVVELPDPTRAFAFTFGIGGRFLLNENSYSRQFGMRTALNLIAPAGSPDSAAAHLRSVDTKQVSSTKVLRSRRQTAVEASLEEFDIDRVRELLRKVVGTPQDRDLWGTRVVGGDSLGFTARGLEFGDFGALCTEMDDAGSKDDYREHFSFVDDLRAISDPNELEPLEDYVVGVLSQKDPDGLFELSPPDILDYERIRSFQYPFDRKPGPGANPTRPEVRLGQLLAHSTFDGGPTRDDLLHKSIFGLDGAENVVDKWSLWSCINGTFELEGRTYAIDDGEIYEVSTSYLAELNQYLQTIPETDTTFPDSPISEKEPAYNIRAAAHLNAALLDAKMVRSSATTTGIELCDLLTTTGQLAHVKKGFSSKAMSHLFNQGLVSGGLLHNSRDFVAAAVAKLEETHGEAHVARLVSDGAFSATDHDVCYAIVGHWNDLDLAHRLPLFSRVALRHAAAELRLMGFTVSYKRVNNTLD